ncbi:MAG: PSD1 domain-containing protein [Planctomycetaceae bacterium]|nr:PSD1 domain-containing protein [Planctomycetaceae bacterium]
MKKSFCTILTTLLLLSSLSAAEKVEYNRDIRPILADKCFQCHGPDEKSREAELRLDLRESALVPVSDLSPIKPGDAEHSAVMERVQEADPDLRMPPAATKKTLTAREIELLREWINQGAEYQEHWAFLPVEKVEPPEVATEGIDHPVDRFIVHKLEERGLTPSPSADPRTIIRRLHLDLVGLLPTPERVDAFVAAYESDRSAAIDQLVDELLSSKHYGERWGRHWLDQARYADSNGYTIDGKRGMWPYRDWVIRALNDNMPFDQFTIEQLAGDLLPAPTKSQLVATGFHRNTLINQEGGTDDEQFRNEEVVDRVNTTGAVWMGLTLGCAQCHSHKFDPISQKEYYQLFAFFNHTADVNNAGPTVKVSERELLREDIDPALRAELDGLERRLSELDQTRAARQAAWEKTITERPSPLILSDWELLKPHEYKAQAGTNLALQDDGSLLASPGAKQETYTLSFQPGDEPIRSIRLRTLPHKSLPQQGPGIASNGNFVLSEIEFLKNGKPIPVIRAQADHSQPNYPVEHAVDGNPKTGWAINIDENSPPFVVMNAPHEAHFIFAEPISFEGEPLTIIMHHDVNEEYHLGHFAFDASSSEPSDIFEDPLLQLVNTPSGQRTAAQKNRLTEEFNKTEQEKERAGTENRISVLREQIGGFGEMIPAMVMQELEEPRETYIQIRGDFLRKDKETGLLTANTPEVFPALESSDDNVNRLDLAHWLVSAEHPLTARVTVNRIWMRYFGQGLVKTENDFGTQGTYPTHPKLLDWLAQYFVDSDWSMKKLHKLIVTSETYLQASRHRDDLEQVDPLNLLLARQNRLRLDAEILRDVSLCASGLFNGMIGGPSVHPPQPDGVYAFTQDKKEWKTDEGANRYRRGMYTIFYRSAPYPFLTTFNVPDMQSVCTSRTRTNTPLQSLTMANDATIFEMAQGLAQRLLTEIPGEDDSVNKERVIRLFRLCYAREPSETERERVLAYQQQQQQLFAEDQDAAKAVINPKLAELTSPAIGASWAAVSRAIMNTDEFLTRE